VTTSSQVVVLAEDARQQSLVRRYLYRLGYESHDIRFEKLPAGKGCGEQWVRERYAGAVCAYRARSAKAATALIVVIDADLDSVDRRADQFALKLQRRGLEPRRGDERVAQLIPGRHVETWIICLNGLPADEVTSYKTSLSDPDGQTRSAALRLYE
jgi:hypothetical protein